MMNHYSARLLLQYRPRVDGVFKKDRIKVCEERLVLFDAEDDEAAYEKAIEYGSKQDTILPFANGLDAKIEFVGLLDIDRFYWDEDDEYKEVCYKMKGMVEPTKRKQELIPKKGDLSLFNGKSAKRGEKKLFTKAEMKRLKATIR